LRQQPGLKLLKVLKGSDSHMQRQSKQKKKGSALDHLLTVAIVIGLIVMGLPLVSQLYYRHTFSYHRDGIRCGCGRIGFGLKSTIGIDLAHAL